jgi:hypothetical protein
MPSLLEQAGNAAVGAARTVICGGGGFLLDNLPAIGPTGRAGRELARGVHAALCDLPAPPSLGEPSPGVPAPGQCPGVLYQIQVLATFSSYLRFFPDCAKGATDPTETLIYNVFAPFELRRIQFTGPNGCQLVGYTLFDGPNPQRAVSLTNNRHPDSTATIISVTRLDGLPDDCGEPGHPILPPAPPPVPVPPDIDLPVTPPGGGPDVDFNFSPRVGPVFIGVGGGLFIPVNVRINGPNINVDAPVSIPVNISLPDLNINFPGQGGGGGAPDNPSAPAPPGPPPRPIPGPPRPICCDPRPEPGEDEPVDSPGPGPTPPPGRRLLGLIVRSSVQAGNQNATEIGQGGGDRNLFVPRLANVYFEVVAENSSGQPVASSTTAIPIQVLRQYVPAPESVNVAGWRVAVEPGVSAVVTPLYIQTNRR